MTIDPRITTLSKDVSQWRRAFHERPELGYDTIETARVVAEKLTAFGCDEVVTGIGKTGVVGVIHGRGKGGKGRVIGLRADMDALPIDEETNLPHASKNSGKMHACGHDGHTSMLLGAASHLAATRDFDGTAILIFQPAEEGGAGGRAMCADGMMARFGIEEVYGLHNMPGVPVGQFGICPGPIMAAADQFEIEIEGRGSHAAMPHEGIDPVLIASHMIVSLQTIVSRNVDPLKTTVVSATTFHAGTATNIIPQRAVVTGTVRTHLPEMRALAEARLKTIAEHTAKMHGASIRINYERGYPPTINHPTETEHAITAARTVSGDSKVNPNAAPLMGGEDFAFMLEERPGAYIFMGNGDTAGLHHPAYDFNDAAIPHGIQYWVTLLQQRATV